MSVQQKSAKAEAIILYVVKDAVNDQVLWTTGDRDEAEATCEGLVGTWAVGENNERLWDTKPVIERHRIALGRGRRIRVRPKRVREAKRETPKPDPRSVFGEVMTAKELASSLRVSSEWLERFGINPADDCRDWYPVAPLRRALEDPPRAPNPEPHRMSLWLVHHGPGQEPSICRSQSEAFAVAGVGNSLNNATDHAAWIEEVDGTFLPLGYEGLF